ncbi:hypothetical protein V8E54_014051 [Elaphomyces granulatus]
MIAGIVPLNTEMRNFVAKFERMVNVKERMGSCVVLSRYRTALPSKRGIKDKQDNNKTRKWHLRKAKEGEEAPLPHHLSHPLTPSSLEKTSWNLELKKRLRVPLKDNNAQKFLSVEINGPFLRAAGQTDIFHQVSLPIGPSLQLAQLAKTIVEAGDTKIFPSQVVTLVPLPLLLAEPVVRTFQASPRIFTVFPPLRSCPAPLLKKQSISPSSLQHALSHAHLPGLSFVLLPLRVPNMIM